MVDNDAYADTGEAASLACALPSLHGEAVVVYGDVLFRRYILDGLLTSTADVDHRGRRQQAAAANPRDLVPRIGRTPSPTSTMNPPS